MKLIDGDLVLENNDLAVVDGAEELAQCAEVLLGTNKGEWFLNPDFGLDFKALLGKGVSDEAVIEAVQDALAQEERIQSVNAIQIARADRSLSISLSLSGEDGATEVTANVG